MMETEGLEFVMLGRYLDEWRFTTSAYNIKIKERRNQVLRFSVLPDVDHEAADLLES
jgi:hypothetical protein